MLKLTALKKRLSKVTASSTGYTPRTRRGSSSGPCRSSAVLSPESLVHNTRRRRIAIISLCRMLVRGVCFRFPLIISTAGEREYQWPMLTLGESSTSDVDYEEAQGVGGYYSGDECSLAYGRKG